MRVGIRVRAGVRRMGFLVRMSNDGDERRGGSKRGKKGMYVYAAGREHTRRVRGSLGRERGGKRGTGKRAGMQVSRQAGRQAGELAS